MSSNAIELRALTRLFSAAVFRELARKGKSVLFCKLLNQANLLKHIVTGGTVGDIFDAAFEALNAPGYRGEYIYRSAIINAALNQQTPLCSTSIINEFRAVKSRADVVIFNDTATAYEIKSERDSLARIAKQLENYKLVFSRVCVVASQKHIESLLEKTPSDVGLLCLSSHQQITTVRDALDCPSRISPTSVFNSLRANESIQILKAMGVAVPSLPNTQIHAALCKLFSTLDPVALHREMVTTLARARNLAPIYEFISRLPKSLQAAAVSTPIRRSDHSRLIAAVETPIDLAMSWS